MICIFQYEKEEEEERKKKMGKRKKKMGKSIMYKREKILKLNQT